MKNHKCDQNIESNMSPDHCRVCGKDMSNTQAENWRDRINKSGWFPHLETLGKRSLEEFFGVIENEIQKERSKVIEEIDNEN